MPIEEQLLHNAYQDLRDGQRTGAGQLLPITDRVVATSSLLLKRVGSPGGYLYFTIQKENGDLILNKAWGLAVDVPDSDTWITITWDTPILLNEIVFIFAAQGHLTWTSGNHIKVAYQNTDVKANENMRVVYRTDRPTWDCAYKYTYSVIGPTSMGDGLVMAGEI